MHIRIYIYIYIYIYISWAKVITPSYSRLADAIHWILQQEYGANHLLHYLDDIPYSSPSQILAYVRMLSERTYLKRCSLSQKRCPTKKTERSMVPWSLILLQVCEKWKFISYYHLAWLYSYSVSMSLATLHHHLRQPFFFL